MNTELENILVPVKEVLLDGLNFPKGRIYDHENRIKKLQIATPLITLAYNVVFRKSQDEGFIIFYLARSVDKEVEREPRVKELMSDSVMNDLRAIAKEGRALSLMVPETDEERINSAMLYRNKNNEIFATQLRDPKRGCSASVCSNCYEPNAFADYKCDVCNYELIQAHEMPTIEEWLNSNLGTKFRMLQDGYMRMTKNIIESDYGDWRNINSPLNRFKKRYSDAMA
ncbi:MAG: hypothetical protein AABX61_02295 [Nanoarchaeota archaeon]